MDGSWQFIDVTSEIYCDVFRKAVEIELTHNAQFTISKNTQNLLQMMRFLDDRGAATLASVTDSRANNSIPAKTKVHFFKLTLFSKQNQLNYESLPIPVMIWDRDVI